MSHLLGTKKKTAHGRRGYQYEGKKGKRRGNVWGVGGGRGGGGWVVVGVGEEKVGDKNGVNCSLAKTEV